MRHSTAAVGALQDMFCHLCAYFWKRKYLAIFDNFKVRALQLASWANDFDNVRDELVDLRTLA
jgi:hypothetical protein